MTASEGRGGLVLGGSTEYVVEQYLSFSTLWSVSVVGWGGVFQWSWGWREEMLQCTWSFSNQSIPLRCIVHQLGENDSSHLWILSNMAVLTVKQEFELPEKFENRE
jgi:hypothetical protein